MSIRSKNLHDIVQRWEGNPIINIEDLPFRATDICNASAVKLGQEYLLLLTIESLTGHKRIYLAKSSDGYRFTIKKTPFIDMSKEAGRAIYEKNGIKDPRITLIDGFYYITYVAMGPHGSRIALAKTKDFQKVSKLGHITQVDTTSTALFPEKINGRYAMLERPTDGGRIWITYSDDLIYWGNSQVVLSPRPGHWDFHRIGVSGPPLRVPDGRWLVIYYGIKETSAGPLYRIGGAFLDPDDPQKVLSRTNIPILSPREKYERVGDIGNLVFSCGSILDGNKLQIYYGAALGAICVGHTTIEDIDKDCLESKEEY